MSDYLREFGAMFGESGAWTGGGLVVAVIVLIVLGSAWVVFRKTKGRDGRYDWNERDAELPGPQDQTDMSTDEEMDMQDDRADGFGSGEEKQVELEADVQGLSHRLTVVTVLIPLLFVIVLVFVYLDVSHRIGRLENPDAAGKTVAQALYEDISDQVVELSEKLDWLERIQAKRLSDLEAAAAALEEGLKAHSEKIESVASSKGEGERIKAELIGWMEKLTTRLSSVEEDTAAHGSELQRLSEETAQRAKQTAETLSAQKRILEKGKTQVSQMESELTEVQRRFLELELNQKLLSEAKAERADMASFRAEQQQIQEGLGKRIESLEADITRLAEQYVRFSADTGSVDGVRESDAAPDVPASEGGANIFEQDISQ